MISTREEVSGGDSWQNLFEAAACLFCAQMDVRPPPGWISPRDIPQRHRSRKHALLKEIFPQKFHNIIRSWCCDSGWWRKSLEGECKAGCLWLRTCTLRKHAWGFNVSCRLALRGEYTTRLSASMFHLLYWWEVTKRCLFCFSCSESLRRYETLIPPASCPSKLLNVHHFSGVLQLWSSNISRIGIKQSMISTGCHG